LREWGAKGISKPPYGEVGIRGAEAMNREGFLRQTGIQIILDGLELGFGVYMPSFAVGKDESYLKIISME